MLEKRIWPFKFNIAFISKVDTFRSISQVKFINFSIYFSRELYYNDCYYFFDDNQNGKLNLLNLKK